MEYDLDDSFPFDFEPNEIPFGSKVFYLPTPQVGRTTHVYIDHSK